MTDGLFDVLIAGSGPGGLQAALTLGRARKRVLMADGRSSAASARQPSPLGGSLSEQLIELTPPQPASRSSRAA